jgi:hypothetical protein
MTKPEKEEVDKMVLLSLLSSFSNWCGSDCVLPTSATSKAMKGAKENTEIM